MGLIRKIHKQERGQILILALILLVFSSLIVVPLVSWMGTGLRAVRIYQDKTDRIYAADAGVENAIWRIINDEVSRDVDFSQTYPAITVNDNSVIVKIDYTWLLSGIVASQFGPHNEWINISMSGSPLLTGIYEINLQYNEPPANPANKKIEDMGVWLPVGFEYVAGSSADPAFPDNIVTEEPSVTSIHGGTSIKWTDVNYSFKNSGNIAKQSFRFTPVGELPKGDVAWISSLSADIGLSWDEMVCNYTVTSTATSSDGKQTTVVAHVTRDYGTTPNLAVVTYEIDPSEP